MHLKSDLKGFGADVNDEPVEGGAGPVDEHVADLEKVALDAGQWQGVHAVAQVIAHPWVTMLVEVTHRYPLTEEGRIEEAYEPAALPNAGHSFSAAADLPGGLLREEAAQSQKPDHGQSATPEHRPLGSAGPTQGRNPSLRQNDPNYTRAPINSTKSQKGTRSRRHLKPTILDLLTLITTIRNTRGRGGGEGDQNQ